jgi:hypothetical protein
MTRIGYRDRWKSRYTGIPRLRLGNNGKPWSTKISSLIFVLYGFPLFQAIPTVCGSLCGSVAKYPFRDIQSPNLLLTKGLVLGTSCGGEGTIVNQKTHRGGWANEQDPISFGERWGFCGWGS